MTEQKNRDILLMALFVVTRDDVLSSAREIGLSEAEVSGDVIELVKNRVSQGLGDWREKIKELVKDAIRCPLGMACSASCPFRELGQCAITGELE